MDDEMRRRQPDDPATTRIGGARRARRTMAVWIAAVGVVLAGCGSDKTPAPSSPDTVIDGRQAPGPDGNNPSDDQSGTSVAPTTATSTATADTQEKIDDQSPGGGGGLPSPSGP